MSVIDYLLLMVLMALTTAVTRSFFFLLANSRMPPWLQHALGYVPAVALAAIIAPDLLMSGGQLAINPSNAKLLAGIAATIFFLLTRHLISTLAFGMAVFTLLRLFAPVL
jgi:branched-subunit amino acid transport protein